MNENYTYYWQILSLTKKNIVDKENVIFKVVWKLVGRDQNNVEGAFQTSTGFTLPEHFDENFIEYENLTEQVIINWIEQIIDMNQVYPVIDEEIEKNKQQIEVVFNGYYPWQQVTDGSSPAIPSSPSNGE